MKKLNELLKNAMGKVYFVMVRMQLAIEAAEVKSKLSMFSLWIIITMFFGCT